MRAVKLHGDASYRIYFREITHDGQTRIIMQLPEGKSSVSEEITNLKSAPQELPFLNIARYLQKHEIPVPGILGYDPVKRQIFLEDLGDETVEKKIPGLSHEQKVKLYKKAIDLLVDFHALTQFPDKGCIAFQRSFDQTLYQWEFDHFLEYGIESRLGIKIEDRDHKSITTETIKISRVLSALPRVLTHRDFQSRNLMLQGERLRLIDFQDALLAPPQYDLVALLRDSYIELEWSLVEDLIDHYLKQIPRQIKVIQDEGYFKKMFDWLTIQRKLKDAGRFVYIDRVKKNPSFLKHIPTSLGYVREALKRQPELSPLLNVLMEYVPEFQTIH